MKNVKKSAPSAKKSVKKNVVQNKPKKVDPEQIVKERLAAKAKANAIKAEIKAKTKALYKGKIQRHPEPEETPSNNRFYGNVCEEMPIEGFARSEQEDLLEQFGRKERDAEREDIRNIKSAFSLNLGTDLDKFIKLLKGQGYCSKIPYEPEKITAGRERQLMVAQAEAENHINETPVAPVASAQPITLTVKADDPNKLRGLTITIA